MTRLHSKFFSASRGGKTRRDLRRARGLGFEMLEERQMLSSMLSVANVSVAEGNSGTTAMNFAVKLSAASTQTVSVAYATADGTATLADGDYQAGSGTLTFAPGEISKTVSVAVNGDTKYEPNETLLLKLSAPTNATLGTAQATGTSRNDDAAPPALPTVSIANVSVTEGNSGTTPLAFVVTLSSASTTPVSVQYTSADETATAGSDYTAVSGTLTFAPGETSKKITVAVTADTTIESNETLVMKLTSALAANLGTALGHGTIIDDDAPQPSTFNYGEVLQKSLYFYGAQRSGDLADEYFVSWRGDSGLNDGKDVGVDLAGGYYDAGDHVKFGLPMESSMTLLALGVVQYRDAYVAAGLLPQMLDALKWGTDWLIKAHPQPTVFYGQVGNGGTDHAFWGAPEVMTMNRPSYKIDAQHPGSELAGEAAAALAAASIVFRPTDPVYADVLLQHARELYSFADTYRGKYSDSIPDAAAYYNSYSGYFDELAWGGVWLYKATGETAYLNKAEAIYAQQLAGKSLQWTQSWDDKTYGTAVLLAQLTGKSAYKADAERWLDYWTVGTTSGGTTSRIRYTPGGLAFLDQWGSLRYAANTSFFALLYSDTVGDHSGRYHDFAVRQINYMLGDNPMGQSYVVGFGNNFPLNPHHRGASGVYDGNINAPFDNRHVLYGALVGGPQSASDSAYQDVRTNYVCNEVALDYNAAFQGAIARLYAEFGGDALANPPVPEIPSNEFLVQAALNTTGTNFTEIRALLNNRSAWPARFSSDLSFRYFVDLSEVYQAGYTVADVLVIPKSSLGTTSGLQAWNEAAHVYFVNVDLAGVSIGPGTGNSYWREVQFRIALRNGLPTSAWDPTNDWSYQGLSTNRNQLIIASNIPVYEFGTKALFGQTPSGLFLPAVASMAFDSPSVTEGDNGTTTATLNVRLSAASTTPVTVAYATADGTATAGVDYQAASGTLTFAPGETVKAIDILLQGDTLVEPAETVNLILSNPTNATLAVDRALLSILDDDTPAASASVQFKVDNDWGTGFTASMTVANNGAATINGWMLEFDFDRQITNIWNAEIVSHVGTHYVLRNTSYSALITPRSSVGFGFQGLVGNVLTAPTNITLNGMAIG